MDTDEIKKRIDLINYAISKNIQSIKFDGKEVVYRSLNDMLKAKAALQNELNKVNKKRNRVQAIFSRGL